MNLSTAIKSKQCVPMCYRTAVFWQVICDSVLQLINCIVKWPGSVHDARILRESALFADFESQRKPVSGFLLGDSGYMLRDWLMTPLLTAQSPKDDAYNSAHSVTRSTVEHCIGVIKRRWHCLHTELRVDPAKAFKIICACPVLHNRAVYLHHFVPDDDDDSQTDSDSESVTEDAGACTQSDNARATAAKLARQRLIEQFFKAFLTINCHDPVAQNVQFKIQIQKINK